MKKNIRDCKVNGKCLVGKDYSVKKLADVAEMMSNKARYHDYETARKVGL